MNLAVVDLCLRNHLCEGIGSGRLKVHQDFAGAGHPHLLLEMHQNFGVSPGCPVGLEVKCNWDRCIVGRVCQDNPELIGQPIEASCRDAEKCPINIDYLGRLEEGQLIGRTPSEDEVIPSPLPLSQG